MMGGGCARKTNYVIRSWGSEPGFNSGGKIKNEFIHLTDDSNKLCLCNEILKPLETETQVSSFIG